jgi:peptidoglycan hydrolase FlgJ
MIDTGAAALFGNDSVAFNAAAVAKNAFGKKLDEPAAEKAAKDFESLFLSQMLESMFGESLGSDLFGNKETQEVYKGLMMQEYGRQMVNAGGIGIAAYVKKELLKLQEV